MIYKSRKFKILLILVAFAFIAISSLLSIAYVNGKYYRSLTQNLSLEAHPNKPYSYYIYDANGSSKGVYNSKETISQNIKVRTTKEETIYQIKIPVITTGYYNINFQVDFLKPGDTQGSTYLILSDRMYNPVGCQVVHESTHPFGSATSKLVMLEKSEKEFIGNMVTHDMEQLITARDHYQWKTLAPSLSEEVSLTFCATQQDVDEGYVIWAWCFGGLVASQTYTINLTEIQIEKTLDLNPNNDDPYFNFAEMQYVNNTVNPESSTTAGFTRHTGGKGTFVTEASSNSMTMQISPMFAGWGTSGLTSANGAEYDNIVGFNIPLKNIEYDKTYKVSFDIKIARQGTVEVDSSTTQLADATYSSDYDTFFFNLNQSNTTTRTLMFESYLHSGTVTGRAKDSHNTAKTQINMSNVYYTPSELTRYDELRYNTSSSNSLNEISYNSSTGINDLYTTNGSRANLMNAVRYTEVNVQNTIYWLGFFNTTFSFNISSTTNTGLDLNDLYWVWAIEPLYAGRWFRFKFENVRIEESIQYGANISTNGIKINNTQVTNFNNYTTSEDNFLRGSSGTGQNYQALGYKTDKSMAAYNTFNPIYDAKNIAFSSNRASDYRIYLDGYCVVDGGVEKYVWSPDLGKTWYDMIVESPLTQATQTQLQQAERRVDQTQIINSIGDKSLGSMHSSSFFTESADSEGNHTQVKDHALDFIDFETSDGFNSSFEGFKIYADISAFKNNWEMDIIFAAVPVINSDMRCEILRITNANTRHNYRSYIDEIISDISVLKNIDTYDGTSTSTVQTKKLNAVANGTTVSHDSWKSTACYQDAFALMIGIAGGGIGTAQGRGYASKVNNKKIEDTNIMFSGMPIMNSITLKGWAVCLGGIDSYHYSTDNGKTWTTIAGTFENGDPSIGLADQATWWMDTSITTSDTKKSLFNANSTAIKINLSQYKGQLVDLLVAAKPAGRDAYCPIARIDNISVYGDYTYYTRLNAITIDNSQVINTTTTGEDGEVNINEYNNLRLTHTTVKGTSYSIYEPYGINLFSTRKITATPIEISNGGTISVNGFIVCYGGVKSYKYTIDGGKTWVNINTDISYNSPDSAIMKVAKLVDSRFTQESGSNGNFSTGHGSSKTLDFNIPNTFKAGEKCNLIVAAVSNSGVDQLYPIMNISLVIK